MIRKIASTVSATAIIVTWGCGDGLGVLPASPAAPPPGLAFTSVASDDPALVMRAALRAIPDSIFARRIDSQGRIVVIGFKPDGADRGVSAFGRSLLDDEILSERRGFVRNFARRILYEFEEMPALVAELGAGQDAIGLRALPWIDYILTSSGEVTPDQVFACGVSTRPYTEPQLAGWHISRIRADAAWPIATGNTGLNHDLVVLDDGVDFPGIERNTSVRSWYAPATSRDGEHGTLVLGAANSYGNDIGTVGVAPNAWGRMMKIYDPASGPGVEVWAPVAIANEDAFAHVISMSFSRKPWTSPDPPPEYAAMYDAILVAQNNHSVVFTASTGNQERADWYAFPAAFLEVIGVGGSGLNDEYVLNNYAPGNVTLAAPAVDILTNCKGTTNGTATGTSFSTPQVAGAVMLLRELRPTSSPTQVRDWLTASAVPMADAVRSGSGRLDVYAAVQLAQPSPPPPPPPPFSTTISGPTEISPTATCSWVASPQNGTWPYSFEWYRNSALVSTGSDYTSGMQDASSFTLFLRVTDADWRVAEDEITVTNTGSGECLIA